MKDQILLQEDGLTIRVVHDKRRGATYYQADTPVGFLTFKEDQIDTLIRFTEVVEDFRQEQAPRSTRFCPISSAHPDHEWSETSATVPHNTYFYCPGTA